MDRTGPFRTDYHIAYYSGYQKQRRNSVGFIVRKCIARMIFDYNAVNDQIMLIALVDNFLI